jgi:hypothetical protein
VGEYMHCIMHPQVADGRHGFQIWRVPKNILNKELQTANKRWSFSLAVSVIMNVRVL